MSEPFRVLVVCTGNICRSPMAAAMLTHRLRAALGDAARDAFEVTSAGTGAVVGAPMEPDALDALSGVGVVPDEFEARDITAQLIGDADLILAATRRHRSAVVTAVPSALRRTFTIREFARILEALPPKQAEAADDAAGAARVRALVERAAANRGFLTPAAPNDDVDDPFRRPAAAFVNTAALLDPCMTVIADALVITYRGQA